MKLFDKNIVPRITYLEKMFTIDGKHRIERT